MQEVVDPLRRRIRIKPFAQLGVLRRHADRAAARVAVVAVARLRADLFRVVGLGDILVAVQRHHRRVADGDGIRAQRDGLGHVRAVPDTARVNQADLAPLAKVVDRLPRLADGGHSRYAGILGGKVRAGSGAAFHPVDIDRVRVTLHRHAHVVIDPRRAQLELDRDLPVGRLADLLDLERKVVRAQPVGVTRGRALVDPGRKRTHLGHLVGHLLTHQVPAKAHLAALPDEELAAIGQHQVVRVEPVPRLDALVEPFRAEAPLVGDHPTFARTGRRARHRGAPRQRGLGLIRKRAKGHAGDVDRDIQLKRLLGARPDHRLGLAFLAIALDHEPRQRAGKEGQVIPVRDLLEQREPPHPVAAKLGLDVDVVHHVGREDEAVAQPVIVAAQGLFLWQIAVSHCRVSLSVCGGWRPRPCRRVGANPPCYRINFFSVGSRLS